jgi:hypothetical protein
MLSQNRRRLVDTSAKQISPGWKEAWLQELVDCQELSLAYKPLKGVFRILNIWHHDLSMLSKIKMEGVTGPTSEGLYDLKGQTAEEPFRDPTNAKAMCQWDIYVHSLHDCLETLVEDGKHHGCTL